MLDQRDRGGAPVRDRVGHVPDLVLVEDVAVLERLGTGLGTKLGALLAVGPKADQRTDDRAELHCRRLLRAAHMPCRIFCF